MKNKNGGMLSQILGFSVSTWVNFVVSFLSVSILTRAFMPAEYSIITLFATATEFGMSLMTLGLDNGYLRFYKEPPNNEPVRVFGLKTISICLVIAGIVGIIINVFASESLSYSVFGISSRILTLMLTISVLCNIILRFLNLSYRMNFDAKRYNTQAILLNIAKRLGCLLAIPIAANASVAIVCQVCLILLITVTYGGLQRKSFFPNREEVKKYHVASLKGYKNYLSYSLLTAPTYLINYANTLIGSEIIRTRASAHDLGVYVAAGYFSTAISTLRGGFGVFWAPYMYQNYTTKQNEIKKVHDFYMLLSSLAFLAILIFRDVLFLLLGSEYQDGKNIYSFVVLGSVLVACVETTSYGILIRKKSGIQMMISASYVILHLISCFYLTSHYGLIGAAISALIASLVYFLIDTIVGQHYYRSITSFPKTMTVVGLLVLAAVISSVIGDDVLRIVALIVITGIILIIYREELLVAVKKVKEYVEQVFKKGNSPE